MVLEEAIPRFSQWIGPALLWYLYAASLLAVIGAAAAWLVQSAVYGPLQAGDRVYRGIISGVRDLAGMSPRRIWALARLAIQESLRRNVLVVLALFALLVIFAGWFLDPTSVNPGKLYLGFILTATNFLVCIVTLILSVFSLPADFKAKAIQTVTTKPVRTGEVVLGRMLGFSVVGTALLAVMGAVGWGFVVRSVQHGHELTAEDVIEIRSEDGALTGYEGRTSLDRGHRHRIELGADGAGRTDHIQGHRHDIEAVTNGGVTSYRLTPPLGLLEARKPLRGTLAFLDRQGQPSAKGISVGAEWSYRQYIEGGKLAAAIWTFEGIDPADFPDGLPLEMLVRVFRTHKGNIEKGIAGSVRVRNPKSGLQSDPRYFTAKEFTIDEWKVPLALSTTTADGGTRQVDLYGDIVSDGKVQVILQCLEPGQYFGVAQADFYLRSGNGSFAWNYLKSCLGIWFAMLLVTALGVMFSTFLAGPVALLATLSVVLVGLFRDFIRRLFESQVTGDSTLAPGGGPVESFYRLVTQTAITLDLEQTPFVTAMKGIDTVLMAPMRLGAALFPSLSSLGTGDFVSSGFDIPLDLISAHAAETFGYLLVFFIIGALCLRAREVAS
jgi:hypothetical protein